MMNKTAQVMCDKTKLEKYLFAPINSHAKESLINNKLVFDLKLAAAQREYFLNIYTPEVDKDGFDIIFDDQDSLTKVQLKTVMKKSNTNSWNIHKSLIRPNLYSCEQLGFESSASGTGYQGGVILIEIEDREGTGFQVKYYYLDIILLCGLRDKIIKLNDQPSDKAIKTLIKSISEGTSHETVTIYKNMFVEAKCPASLLALMGMHNTKSTTAFRFHIQQLANPCIDKTLAAPREVLIDFVNGELRQISNSIAL